MRNSHLGSFALISLCLMVIGVLAVSPVSAMDNVFSLGSYKEVNSGVNRQGIGEGYVKTSGNYVITGLGVGSYDNNDYKESEIGPHILRPVVVYARELLQNGSLSSTQRVFSLGNANKAERTIILPDGFVMIGWGGGINAPSRYGNWVVDYLEISAAKISCDGSLYDRKVFVSGSGTVDSYTHLPSGYLATLVRGVVYKGRMERVSIGGKQLSFSGSPSNCPNQTTNQSTNHAPVVNSIIVNGNKAGDLFNVNVNAYDQDNDPLTITYGSPFNANGEWQTSVSTTTGVYDSFVIVSDGKNNTLFPFSFIVSNANTTNNTNQSNSAPMINSVIVNGQTAGDLFSVIVSASDANNDSLTITYSAPFNANGLWQTSTSTQSGNYNSFIIVSDGRINVSRNFSFIVNPYNQTTNTTNHAPIIDDIDYEGDEEGDTFRIIVEAYDPDGDSLTITCSSPFGSDCKWKTRSGDADDYEVTIYVSDGKVTVTDSITVFVDDDSDSNNKANDNIRYVGEFQDNDLALNNLLYHSQDDATRLNTPSISSDYVIVGDRTTRTFSLITLFLTLIVILLVIIIITIIYKRSQ